MTIHDLGLARAYPGVGSDINPVCVRPKEHLVQFNAIRQIQSIVAEYYRIPASTMTAATRAARFSHPRQMAMFLARRYTCHSLLNIGRHFGGRDHTTVIHALNAVQRRLGINPGVAVDLAILQSRIAA